MDTFCQSCVPQFVWILDSLAWKEIDSIMSKQFAGMEHTFPPWGEEAILLIVTTSMFTNRAGNQKASVYIMCNLFMFNEYSASFFGISIYLKPVKRSIVKTEIIKCLNKIRPP